VHLFKTFFPAAASCANAAAGTVIIAPTTRHHLSILFSYLLDETFIGAIRLLVGALGLVPLD
jgi:hypothetical protein